MTQFKLAIKKTFLTILKDFMCDGIWRQFLIDADWSV